MMNYLIKDINIVNEGKQFRGHVWVKGERIVKVSSEQTAPDVPPETNIIDGKNRILIPGVIDDQVHFRDPGHTHKGDIYTESRAAVAGGITSFMEMPNTSPQTTSNILLEEKFKNASKKSLSNYSFYLGATNDNLQELQSINRQRACGIKIFMGASTGNMLVDNPKTLAGIFSIPDIRIAVHCEDEGIIKRNMDAHLNKYGENIPIECHPQIRSAEACYTSSSYAVALARKHNTNLHLIHVSTAKELDLLSDGPHNKKQITSEVCIHHMWFEDSDYDDKGTLIKWNPAIKSAKDRDALIQAVLDDKLDIIATDHAPHTIEEKDNPYTKAPSGGPMVQHSLPAMLEYYHQGIFPIETIIQKMCHAPADIFQVRDRGYIREGFLADLVIIDLNDPWTVNKQNILYKCGWSPLEGAYLKSRVTHTFVNGHLVFDNGIFNESKRGQALEFNR
jgi:dihydroorotase